MKCAVSACLLGISCKYNGSHNRRQELIDSLQGEEILPVCPETAGGLDCPRVPSERRGDAVIASDGRDVTSAFFDGARRVADQIEEAGINRAYLKSKSPSCGKGVVYDGSFSGSLTEGNGVLVDLLEKKGIEVISVD